MSNTSSVVKGLSVSVLYQMNGDRVSDCTNRGVTSPTQCKGDAILIWDAKDSRHKEGTARIFEPRPGVPVLKVRNRNGYLSAVPVNDDGTDKPGWFMAGGNFVYTSDSRFPGDYPIPVHDRQEDAQTMRSWD